MYARRIALAALTLVSLSATAADYTPGAPVQMQGTVVGFQSGSSFWLDVAGERVLVYGTSAQRSRLSDGQVVRIEGRVVDDFIKMAEIEVHARTIEALRAGGATTTAALQAR
ncbi:MAG: hypothetical protein U1F26_14275 [Lysobacterales bacterium]